MGLDHAVDVALHGAEAQKGAPMHLGEGHGARDGSVDVTLRHLHRDGEAHREPALAKRALHERQIGVEPGQGISGVLDRRHPL